MLGKTMTEMDMLHLAYGAAALTVVMLVVGVIAFAVIDFWISPR